MLTPAQKRNIAFERNVAFSGFMLHFMVQIAHISCPWHERWQRILSVLITTSIFLFPTFCPETYLRYRNIFLFTFRIAFFSFPLLRKPRGIQRVLNAPASPGLMGCIIDLVKMAWGMPERPVFFPYLCLSFKLELVALSISYYYLQVADYLLQ